MPIFKSAIFIFKLSVVIILTRGWCRREWRCRISAKYISKENRAQSHLADRVLLMLRCDMQACFLSSFFHSHLTVCQDFYSNQCCLLTFFIKTLILCKLDIAKATSHASLGKVAINDFITLMRNGSVLLREIGFLLWLAITLY